LVGCGGSGLLDKAWKQERLMEDETVMCRGGNENEKNSFGNISFGVDNFGPYSDDGRGRCKR